MGRSDRKVENIMNKKTWNPVIAGLWKIVQLIFETNILAKLEEGRLFNALSCGLFLTYNI